MTLKLYYHPLSSFCHKVLIALYECGAPFEPVLVNLGDPQSRGDFLKVWAGGKFPVLTDGDQVMPESTIIIEYLAQRFPGKLIPADPGLALQTRLRDRFFDFYIHLHMQKIIGDRMRPADQHDPYGVEDARRQIRNAYDMLEKDLASPWAMGADFTLADCAAAPALFYASMAEPFGPGHTRAAAYLERLKTRPSYARTLKEAEPYFHMIPK